MLCLSRRGVGTYASSGSLEGGRVENDAYAAMNRTPIDDLGFRGGGWWRRSNVRGGSTGNSSGHRALFFWRPPPCDFLRDINSGFGVLNSSIIDSRMKSIACFFLGKLL